MYKNLKSRIKHNNCLSEVFIPTLGVAQGECISPFLFSMYLNDLEQEFLLKGYEGVEIGMLKLCLLLYADDVLLFSETEQGLQQGFIILQEYCDKWKLTVNTEKTKVMIFKKGGRQSTNIFTFNGKNIEVVSKFNYLGVVFTCGGAFSETHSALSGQALKAIYKLKSYLNKFTNITIKHRLDLFDKMILPILNFGSEVWGFHKETKLEKVHLNFCKQLLGVRQQTQNNFIYGELGRVSLKVHRLIAIIRYWLKIVESPENKYIKHVYLMMLNDIEILPNKVSWASNVKSLLESLGLNHAWINQSVGNSKAFLSLCKQRLTDQFVQTWQAEINDSTRADSYKLFSDFGFKSYLNVISITKFRTDLTRLRISAHRLNIEMGRWHKPSKIPRNERKCFICHTLEDEFHFILECSLYRDQRKKFINHYYWRYPNILKFKELMSTDNQKILKNLATYVHKCFEIRNRFMYLNDVS